ncbi:hypothetical protein J6590_005564 [Homalodisca vitripennis]|nr:hypothetical protein J6590_005564 [Homalodisca vitripennis]
MVAYVTKVTVHRAATVPIPFNTLYKYKLCVKWSYPVTTSCASWSYPVTTSERCGTPTAIRRLMVAYVTKVTVHRAATVPIPFNTLYKYKLCVKWISNDQVSDVVTPTAIRRD